MTRDGQRVRQVADTADRAPHKAITAIGQYLAEVRSIPLLSKTEEWRLGVQAAGGNRAAVTALVQSHLPLVVGVARRYAGWSVPIEDLIQEGNLGLMRAAERFDPSRGVRFANYATWWVRQHIARAMFRLGRNIRVPRSIILEQHRLGMISTALQHRAGRRPTDAELAAALARPAARIRFLRSVPEEPVSFDDCSDRERSLAAVPEPAGGDGNDIVRTLPPRLREVVCLRFGLQDGQCKTLREIGSRLHISRERARQLEQRALRRLREHEVA
jgi:RNA polymerase primary sigma factor